MKTSKPSDSDSRNRQPLITVEAALDTILEKIAPIETEIVPLTRSPQRILAEPITSQINIPPFTNSAMDGYAVIAANIQEASRQNPVLLKIVDNIPAGATASKAITPRAIRQAVPVTGSMQCPLGSVYFSGLFLVYRYRLNPPELVGSGTIVSGEMKRPR